MWTDSLHTNKESLCYKELDWSTGAKGWCDKVLFCVRIIPFCIVVPRTLDKELLLTQMETISIDMKYAGQINMMKENSENTRHKIGTKRNGVFWDVTPCGSLKN
jgi:hypothetical protein